MNESHLHGLDPEQLAAVTAPDAPLRVLAGAGTGKTRVLTRRIAHLAATGTPTRSILAVTHSKRAAGELTHRLNTLGVTGVQARTFHAAALRQLAHFWSHTHLPGTGPNLLGTGERYGLIRTSLAHVTGTDRRDVESGDVSDLAAEISWARARRLPPADYPTAAAAAGRTTNHTPTRVADIYHAYTEAKIAQQRVDFEDLLSYTAQLIETTSAVAAAVRGAYTHFLVDEYQDTDANQQRLLEAWLGGREHITVVGDAQQAIYGFKGAQTHLIDTFPTRHPGAATVTLVRDYRSTPQVVAAANATLATAPGPKVTLIGQQPEGAPARIHAAGTPSDELAQIVTLVRTHIAAGTPAKEIAVLHRFNAQAPAITAALTKAGIPATSTDPTPFFEREEITTILRGYTSRATSDPHAPALPTLAAAAAANGYDKHETPTSAAARERHEAITALLDLARTIPTHEGTCAELTPTLVDLASHGANPHGGAVNVSTIHAAKGLEWDAVIIAHATEGSLPSLYATTEGELDEERRLFYVAITRARHRLDITHATTRENGNPTRRSRLLTPLLPATSRTRPSSPGQAQPRRQRKHYPPNSRVNHDSYGLGWVVTTTETHAHIDFGASGRKSVPLHSPKLQPL